ncbi:MAG: DUF3305 domain-containing protein [Rubrivivax sp.]
MPTTPTPTLTVAVLLERRRSPNRWEAWTHALFDVMPDDGQFGAEPHVLRDDGSTRLTLFPGLHVTLHRDEGEGYHLNLSSGAPVWFVMWRSDDEEPSRAWPERVTLSYNEAGRLLDAQERVDNVPLPAEVTDWLREYTEVHYKPEPKRRQRPASFRAPDQR